MSKKKKKSPLRSEFTDALDEEISTRKILERANLKESEPPPEPPKVIVAQVELQPPVKETPAPVKEIPAPVEEIPVPPSIEVKPETKLEERILNEADNKFFDEKPARKSKSEPVDDKPPKSTYRSKALRKWEEERDEKNPPPNPIAQAAEENEPSRTSRTERAGAIISIVMVIYAFVNLDKPLFFLSMSLLVHCFRPTVGALSGKYSHDVQNAMRSFSIVLFFGAILFIFL